jgi:predicted DNA-binding mobile mystery protein A
MKTQKLILEQTTRKVMILKKAEELVIPPEGWIYSIRQALGMSLRQLGTKMKITPQSVREIEMREKAGTVSLKVLKQFGKALNMKLVYGFIPEKGSLDDTIQKRAFELAEEIVRRASVTMILEDQETDPANLQNAIKEKAAELKSEMPKYLWD